MPDPNPDKPDAPGRRSSASRGGTRSSRAAGAADEPGPDEPGQDDASPGELGRARALELERLRGTLKRKFH